MPSFSLLRFLAAESSFIKGKGQIEIILLLGVGHGRFPGSGKPLAQTGSKGERDQGDWNDPFPWRPPLMLSWMWEAMFSEKDMG